MPTYTAADAANPAIVRAALESALVSGESRPRVTFDNTARVTLTNGGQWDARIVGATVAQHLTTEQAVAAIVAARTGRN